VAILRAMQVGQELDLGHRVLTLAKFRQFMHNPSGNYRHHTDYAEAQKIGLSKPLAPGIMLAAYVQEMLANVYGEVWLTSGSLDLSFAAPAFPGDTVQVTGRVQDLSDGIMTLSIRMVTLEGRNVLYATARAARPE